MSKGKNDTEQNAQLRDVHSYSVINYLPVILFLFNLNPDDIKTTVFPSSSCCV